MQETPVAYGTMLLGALVAFGSIAVAVVVTVTKKSYEPQASAKLVEVGGAAPAVAGFTTSVMQVPGEFTSQAFTV